MALHRLALSEPDLTLFLLDSSSVLHSACRQALYGLDTAATVQLLRRAEEGASLSEGLPTPLPAATAGGGRSWWPLPAAPQGRGGEGPVYHLCGRRFLLGEGFAADAPWRRLLADLVDESGESADIVVDAAPGAGGWQLRFNGAALDSPVADNQLFPHLLGRLRVLAYQGRDFLLAIHGAVLAREGCGLLLPGSSGAGKSTLSLALLTRGYHLLSDELAVVDAVSHRALPVPTPVAVKEGSRAALAGLYPELDTADEYARWDGQRVRYVAIDEARFATAPCAIERIVFPRFESGATLACRRLDPIEALREVTAAGYQLALPLDADKAEAVLHWLLRVPTYALRYGTTEQALEGIARCYD